MKKATIKTLEKLKDGEKLILRKQGVYIDVERINYMNRWNVELDYYRIKTFRSGDAPREYYLGLQDSFKLINNFMEQDIIIPGVKDQYWLNLKDLNKLFNDFIPRDIKDQMRMNAQAYETFNKQIEFLAENINHLLMLKNDIQKLRDERNAEWKKGIINRKKGRK